MFCFGVFIFGTLLSAICSGRWLIDDEATLISAITSFDVTEMQAAGGMGLVGTIRQYWDALVTMLAWNYPYLDNAWGEIFKFFLYIISVGVVFGFVQMFSVVISGAITALRSILPGV